MDISQLAQTLAPVLPYLLKGGIELAKNAAGELGKKLSADSWEGLKKLAEKIQKKAEAKPAAADALQRATEKPDDPRLRGMVELYLEEILKENPDLLAEAQRLLAPIQAASTTVIASGNRSVAIGGNASGNVIITGDNNSAQTTNLRTHDETDEKARVGRKQRTIGTSNRRDKSSPKMDEELDREKAEDEYMISVAHPQALSKGYSSLFLVQIYPSFLHDKAGKMVFKTFGSQKVDKHTWDIKLENNRRIRIKLSSPVLVFSDPTVKQVKEDIITASFTAIPDESCHPGIHYGIVSISDAETQVEYLSLSFSVRVEDFAFDHVSRPFLSKVTSVVLGFGSLTMFILSALEQVDKTLGLTSGTAFAFLASAILLRLWNVFHRASVIHTP